MTPRQTQPFDMANHLRNEEEIAEYLRQVLQDNDPAELAGALGDIAHHPDQAQVQPQIATRKGKGIHGAVTPQQHLPRKALVQLGRQ
ncbi:MAG: transcriptional regulator, partial [Comamonas sp.]|nr:transcriptional regulator [Comamonas sp.]